MSSFEDRLALVRVWPVLPLVLGTYIGSIVLLPRATHAGWAELIKLGATFAVALGWWLIVVPRKSYSLRQVIGQRLDVSGWTLVCLGTLSAFWVRAAWAYCLTRWGTPLGVLPAEPARQLTGLLAALVDGLAAAVLWPVLEELVFRGMIFRKWRRRWGPTKAALASSLLFGLLHTDVVGAGFGGLVDVLLYTRARTLWAPIAAHCLNNGLALMFQYYRRMSPHGLSGISDELFYSVSLACLAVSAAWLVHFGRRSWKTLGDPLPPDR